MALSSAAAAVAGEGPCNSTFVGAGIAPTINMIPIPPGGAVVPGQVVTYRVSLETQEDAPPVIFCAVEGGQLSVTLPDWMAVPLFVPVPMDQFVEVAGYLGTPDVPEFGFDNPFIMFLSEPYVAAIADADANGFLNARVDYGNTDFLLSHNMSQVNGNFLSDPIEPTASATASNALRLLIPDISIEKSAEPTTVCLGEPTSVTYTYVVTNTGEADLANVVVSDDTCDAVMGPMGDDGDGLLNPKEAWIYTCTALVSATTTNTATVEARAFASGEIIEEPVYTDTDTATVTAMICEMKGACCFDDGSCGVMEQDECEKLDGLFQGFDVLCIEVQCPQPPGACCLLNGQCAFVTQAQCLAQNGYFQGAGISCGSVSCPQIKGACCLGDGACAVLSQANCASAGGLFQGFNVLCQQVQCPQPPAACCLSNGQCVMLTQPQCVAQDGLWQGAATDCFKTVCPEDKGACCFPDGTCAVMPQALCLRQAGAYQGNDTACPGINCSQPFGACCFTSGLCGSLPQAVCTAQGGYYQGNFTLCSDVGCPQPKGACCFDDGSCAVLTQAACLAAQGLPQGANTSCAQADCDAPPGGCCLPSGNCVILSLLDCLEADGLYQGDGSSCGGVVCPEPKGACCFASGACALLTQTLCTSAGGFFQGANTLCASTDCPDPQGACCLPGGSCNVMTQAACNTAGGSYLGDGTLCTPDPCPDQVGACCFPNGTCTIVTQARCGTDGGAFQGVGTTCVPNTCPQPQGACCLPNGTCNVLTQAACAAAAGSYQGHGTLCAPNPCPPQVGACCFPSGFCGQLTEANCIAAGGVPQGAGVPCTPALCPPPKGACCLEDGTCVVVTQAECASMGLYQGNNTLCSPNPCPPPKRPCCLPDGSCVVVLQLACEINGGMVQKKGETCVDVICPKPGACCLQDGMCVQVMHPDECKKMGGVYQGNDTVCTPSSCPGACCLFNGTCIEVSLEECLDQDGNYLGFDTDCDTEECPGACCLFDGTCIEVSLEECLDQDGIYQGFGTDCTTTECPGACCLPGSECQELTSAECAAEGGDFQGFDTTCERVDCPGACCLPPPPPPSDFTCTNKIVFMTLIWDGNVPVRIKVYDGLVGAPVIADIDNIQVGDAVTVGPYAGPNDNVFQVFHAGTSTLLGLSKFHRSCSDDDMDGPEDCGKRQGNGKMNEAGLLNDWILNGLVDGTGASFDCGFGGADESCLVLTSAACVAMGGTYQGDGTDCESVKCVGACCLPDVAPNFECTDKIEFMTLIWDGSVPVRIKAYDGAVGAPVIADIDNIQVGDTITVGPYAGPNDNFFQVFHAGTNTLLGLSKYHRSCSDDDMDGPEDCGKRQGNGKMNEAGLINDWILEGLVDGSGASFVCGGGDGDDCVVVTAGDCAAMGGAFQGFDTDCESVDCIPPAAFCEGGAKPKILVMQYTGDNCGATQHSQAAGKVTCSGDVDFMPLVRIRASNSSDPNNAGALVYHDANVMLGDLFEIDATMAGQTKLATDTWMHIFVAGGGPLLQTVKFHTSCSQPLNAGDQYGAAKLLDFVPQ
jgi:uncharacterized repeat protein (TIGR01451 family)